MAKHGKSKSRGGSGPIIARRDAPRSAPIPKKARVEVRYEGGPPKPVNGKPNPTKPTAAPHSANAKGKAKAVEPLPTGSAHLVIPANGSAPSTASTFLIIAGSYEKLLYGLEGSYEPGSSNPSLKPIFIFPAHLACVKAIAASPGGKWLATGSEDEFVKVWDLRRRKEVGSLTQHEGSITSLHFPTSSHLVTTSVDATISLFRTTDWALLKSLKGHSGRVNHVDVHPTGRVALSVGKDGTLRMWDLMRGRGAASLPLGSEAELVKFSPSGTHFAVLFPRDIQIYSLTLKLLHTLDTTSRFNTFLFASLPSNDGDNEVLCVGTEKGVVEIYRIAVPLSAAVSETPNMERGSEGDEEHSGKGSGADVAMLGSLIGHTNRVKSISALPFLTPSSDSTSTLRHTVLLTSVSSDGIVNLYDLGSIIPSKEIGAEAQQISPLSSYDTKGSRLTCVFLVEGKTSSAKASMSAAANGHRNGGDLAPDAAEDIDEGEGEEGDEDLYGSEQAGEDTGMAVEFEEEEREEAEEEEDEEEKEAEEEEEE